MCIGMASFGSFFIVLLQFEKILKWNTLWKICQKHLKTLFFFLWQGLLFQFKISTYVESYYVPRIIIGDQDTSKQWSLSSWRAYIL